jgi:alanine racemase
MDNLTVDLGGDPAARTLRGHEAVLIGARERERITAEEIAARLATINYEVTCALTPRVPRLYHRDGQDEVLVQAPLQRIGGPAA